MIFVVVGTQAPFDRLIQVVDRWAGKHQDERVVAQIGVSSYKPVSLDWSPSYPKIEFDEYVKDAALIVGHAGMGTIISGLEHAKPVIVMPRLSKFGEHRNDHQVDTARRFEEDGYLTVAWDEIELEHILARWKMLVVSRPIKNRASSQLLEFLAKELEN